MVSCLSHQLVKNTIVLLRQNDPFTHWLNENEEEEGENWTLLYVCDRCYLLKQNILACKKSNLEHENESKTREKLEFHYRVKEW